VEFYASSTEGVARLDSDGHEVWRRQTANAALLDVLPRANSGPAWIVEYGRRVLVWDESGKQLAEFAVRAETSPIAVVDGFAGRRFFNGGNSARGFDLQGQTQFEVPLGEFTLSTAAAVRLSAGRNPIWHWLVQPIARPIVIGCQSWTRCVRLCTTRFSIVIRECS
jgi:hypothetical protein